MTAPSVTVTEAETAVHPGEDSGACPSSVAREVWTGSVTAALGLAIVGAALLLPNSAPNFINSPVFWPLTLGVLTTVGGIAIAITGARKPGVIEEDQVSRHGLVQLAIFIPAIVLYGLLWQVLHFVPITLVLVAGLSLLMGGRGWRALILFPVVVTAILFGVFGLLLRVPL
ncbi:hypothetical protein JOF28_001508 [Leucobacter exalbidus]|uniref:DUF1468 domain-containing protein n=1 Tax=Leucobacter exalbidus TaxID=662960 RepID=A0A940PY42_9MICO|nr:tripartite tricarboxylate transporter TctB family protein [Leucobacter exalbidus]MBP1326276.1 hypothetical protein [Leucobacter exalbidus]